MSTSVQKLFDLSGKTALITGGSRGLGLQIAEALGEAGLSILGTSGRAKATLWSAPLPARLALVLGSEGEGIDASTLEQLPNVVQIPGTGAVESLNVACAASVILAESWRSRSASAGNRPPRSLRRRP